LLGQQSQHEPAVAEQERDRAELARLEGELAELHRSKLDPERMAWTEID